MRGQRCWIGAHGCTSIKGLEGILTALNEVGLTSRRSVFNRTGTSNSYPALTAAFAAGTAPAGNTTSPVTASIENPAGRGRSLPLTATRTDDATGFRISRW